MEMGTSWRVWFTLLLFYKAGPGRAGAGATELSRIVGEPVTFPLGIPAEQVRTVIWTVNTTRSIVIVTAGNPPNVIVFDPSYEGRLRVPESNSLQITSLRMQDTGTYGAQISTAPGTSSIHSAQITTAPVIIHRSFLLRMYKQVPAPTVRCDSVTCENETCNYNLNCTVGDGGDNVTYSWTHTAEGAVVPNVSILHISLRPRDAPVNVTCTAQNPVSNSSTTASAKGLCAAKPPGSQSAHTARIVVPIVIVISLIIIALWFVHKQRRKRVLKYTPRSAGDEEADAEKNTVYAQVGSLPLPSSRTGTRKERLETKEDEMKTIYATVQSPNQSPPQTDDEKLGKDGLESTEKGEKTIYVTVNQATQARETKTTKSTDADDSAATSIPQRATEYDKII